MNSSMQFAALAMLCLFPFLFMIAAAFGTDLRQSIVTRLGLNTQAAKDINSLIFSGAHGAAGFSVLGVAFLVLGAMGIAGTLQSWYRRVYDQPAHHGWVRQGTIQLIWLGSLLLYLTVQVLTGKVVGPLGGPLLSVVLGFLVAVFFFWWTVYVLLWGRVGWRALLPTALATGICVTGLTGFSRLLFSSSVVSSHKSYGPIGVVMVLLSYLVGLGVCVHLGAILGRMWSERRSPPALGNH